MKTEQELSRQQVMRTSARTSTAHSCKFAVPVSQLRALLFHFASFPCEGWRR